MLSIVPNPLPDESLSSWLERIAMFYGGEYDRALNAVCARAEQLPLCQQHDIDTDVHARESLGAWTDSDTTRVPAILETDPLTALPMLASLAYCPACWDADVALGHPPYLRRRWALWPTVHCPTHACWPSAKRPTPFKQCLHDGWTALWRSRESWASSLELGFHRTFVPMLAAFDPAVLNLPTIDWPSLSANLVGFERATDAGELNKRSRPLYLDTLKLMKSGSFDALPHQIGEHIDPDGYCRNIPMHTPGFVPVWFGARLVLMLMAVECVTLQDEDSVDEEVSRLLCTSPDLRRSLRSLHRRVVSRIVKVSGFVS